VPKGREKAIFTAAYDNIEGANTDLDAIEALHRDDFLGTFDAAIIGQKDGKPHIVKRIDRPVVHIIPEELDFGPLFRK
jgi:hypothetical protein